MAIFVHTHTQRKRLFHNLLCAGFSSISPEDPCFRSHMGHPAGDQLLPAGAQGRCGDEGEGTDEDVLAARRDQLQ